MIITINGDNGAGKSTISTKIAEELGYKRHFMGQIHRDVAKEKGITLEELHAIREKDPKFDKAVDDFLINLGKESDNFVIDSRTAWHFLPNSLKLYLKVDDTEAAKRIFLELQQENKRNEASGLDSEEKVLESVKKRNLKDTKLYKELYGIDIRDEKNFDFILDTTHLSIEEVFEKVMEFIKSKIK